MNTLRRSACGVLAFVALSCQTPVQPTDKIVGSGFPTTVNVVDQTGATIAGAKVEWALLRGASLSEFTAMGSPSTGQFSAVIPVPIADSNVFVLIRTTPPVNDPTFIGAQNGGNTEVDTLRVCSSLSFRVVLQRRQTVTACAQAVTCRDLATLVALPAQSSDTTATDQFVNATGVALTLTISPPANPAVRWYVVVNRKPGALQPPAIATVIQPNDTVQIKFIFTPAANAGPSRTSDAITITGASATDPKCLQCSFTLTEEVTVVLNCDCPPPPPVITYPPAPIGADSVCVGETTQLTVPLSIVRNDNTNANCVLLFTLLSQTADPAVQLLSINGDPANGTQLTPGNALTSLVFNFSPTSAVASSDTFRYAVQLRNTQSNTVKSCDTLTIAFNGMGTEAVCKIDTLRSSLFLKPSNTIASFGACVGVDNPDSAKTLCIENVGQCDLHVTASTVGNPFSVTPSDVTLRPKDTVYLTIKFVPQDNDVWPSGRGAAPAVVNFNGMLTITGCTPASFPLVGTADTACHFSLSPRLHQWGELQGNWFESIVIHQNDNSLLYTNTADSLGKRDVYVQSVDVTNQQAVLASDYATWTVVGNHPPSSPSETVCSFAANYLSSCGSGTQTPQTVKLWDVIIFQLQYTSGRQVCGVIWVTNIENDKTVQGVPQVGIQICYPI